MMRPLAVVTGASGGIGSAIARRLAAGGHDVVVGYGSRRERADEVVASLDPGEHVTCAVDVTNSASLDALAAVVAERGNSLAVLVNCVGVTRAVPHGDLDGLDDALFDTIMATNVRGVFATIRALAPALRTARGCVVSISSVAGVTGLGSNVAYCASKAAVDSMTRSLARALAPDVRVVSVSPGWVLGEYSAKVPQELLDAQLAQTPLGRFATADDVAQAVWAAVELLPLTTGSIIPVDGGRPLGRA